MKHFIEAIYYQYYLYYKRSKYDWKISPEESACWALGFSFFFPLFNFCAFIFLCILHEINYHWYYLIPFYIGWIGVNKICEKKFLLNGYYKHIIKEKPVFWNILLIYWIILFGVYSFTGNTLYYPCQLIVLIIIILLVSNIKVADSSYMVSKRTIKWKF